MNNYQDFIYALNQARSAEEPILEVCITDTDGSSYRKSGARMLIDAHGMMTGLVTGGCLEGELSAIAPGLLSNQKHQVLEYDMRTMDPNQCVFGPGCNGRVRVRINCLSPQNGYGALAHIAEQFPNKATLLSAIDESGDYAIKQGASFFATDNMPTNAQDIIGQATETPELVTINGKEFLLEIVTPAKRLTLLGASSDARLLANMAQPLGFYVQLLDDREAYIKEGQAMGLKVSTFADAAFDVGESDAIVVMSHDYDKDIDAIKLIQTANAPYIGMLGPADRRDRVLKSADLSVEFFGGRLYGPAGLDIGADSSDQIVVSILAEMLAVLNNRSADSLRDKAQSIHA
ncbi:XdhC family protein [Reinekea forsetii]|nr:XdhC family protein [Reinekea forsetii]